ncbi:FAD-dependent oxidoreductase [Mycolicibacterium austroafricanum]|uniref:FAD-dependent oxidoreductase n=1 Tax=Mycolicibacterium austroafricanum TaxID=39687 RepID=UPI001CA30089|nr:FAD-dependent oxidoreductase [Mycolicibacterium austroafricanum]QZT58581.1 FAD-dependent oxidoreductase [Mycolicibacterium austroafricanum]
MHVVTRSCCSDAACVAVCPANCIHPRPDEPGFGSAEMLYVDPATCVDCGACADVCPVDAVKPAHELTPRDLPFVELNARYYDDPAHQGYVRALPTRVPATSLGGRTLRVAIVGSGPAACYAAENLLTRADSDVEVNIFERLPTPWGLVRFGVAPDHPDTKSVSRSFERLSSLGATFYFGVEVGRDVSVDELTAHHHAVVYAVGAANSRRLEIPGSDLTGVHSAQEFVAWYNGHPDFVDREFDLSAERAIVIGNGNVALDVARILGSSLARLAETDIADHTLAALASSNIREVVVLARRGPADAAYTLSEFIALRDTSGIRLRVEDRDFAIGPEVRSAIAATHSAVEVAKLEASEQLMHAAAYGGNSVTLRYLTNPVALLGDQQVSGIRVECNEADVRPGGDVFIRPTGLTEDIDCGLVFYAIGYAGSPIAGLPFDGDRMVIPNEEGRVREALSGKVVSGTYVTGWIKRGPTGVIGSNKACAQETVNSLISDYQAGVLSEPALPSEAVPTLVERATPHAFGYEGWQAIDRHERERGKRANRPRRKLVRLDDLTATALAYRHPSVPR